jgi:hypothetical protein
MPRTPAWPRRCWPTVTKQNIGHGQLTIHADRGSPMTAKPVAFSTGTSVSDINDHGDLVGVHGAAPDGLRGFALRNRPHARFESFSAPGARYTLAFGINDRRQIVGTGATTSSPPATPEGSCSPAAPPAPSPASIRGTSTRTLGLDIENRGQIVAGAFPTTAPDQPSGAAQSTSSTPATSPTSDNPASAAQPT